MGRQRQIYVQVFEEMRNTPKCVLSAGLRRRQNYHIERRPECDFSQRNWPEIENQYREESKKSSVNQGSQEVKNG